MENHFQYRLFMMYLDLQELPRLFRGTWFWSVDRVNLAYLRRRDHLGDPRVPLDHAVRDLVQERVGSRPRGPIRFLTHLRYFGHCFNPVSFYYFYDRQDRHVETTVAEVHNPPWGEEHCYVFPESMNEHPSRGWKPYRFSKAFHVSPFMEMDISYDWRFREPGETLSVHIENLTPAGKRFDATLTKRPGCHRPIHPPVRGRRPSRKRPY